ncbi:hypothetical protein SASPL_108698 [Salvia splendens]|uniref:Ty3 transposon capsid-like protein domain-containing protein n=1 Tax=Salvia splendens TaxID=180675 RepID=A0A8X8YDJ4_SALSN|nr:hypothetical protein SASPL_108698 [Salvia splendens]
MTTIGSDSDTDHAEKPHEYTTQEIGQMLFEMQLRAAKYEKKMMTHKHEQEAFARQQATTNRNIDESLAKLAATIGNHQPRPPNSSAPPTRGWAIPPSITTKPVDFNPDNQPKLTTSAPRFNDENVVSWIRKIQKHYNHSFTPLVDRLYLTSFLFDDAAEEWLTYWEDNVESKDWDGFLLAVKKRFDPDLYEDYVGRLASLKQTASVEAYQTSFEAMLQKVKHVGDETLTSLFIAGLKPSIRHELLTRRTASLQDAFALAQRIAACQLTVNQAASPRPAWSSKTSTAATQTRDNQLQHRTPREGQPPSDYPIVRVSSAERAERTKKGQCWYCPEPYSRTHVCSKKFYAFIGADDEDDEADQISIHSDDEGENMAITGAVSSIHVLCPKIKPRSIRMKARINGATVVISFTSTYSCFKLRDRMLSSASNG